MKRKGLPALGEIAAALLEAERARLRAAGALRARAEAKVADLDAAVARQHAVIAAELEAPVAGRVLDRWGGWADRRRSVLTLNLARERAAWEQQRQATLWAFGRAEALKRLAAETAAEARRKARRDALKKTV